MNLIKRTYPLGSTAPGNGLMSRKGSSPYPISIGQGYRLQSQIGAVPQGSRTIGQAEAVTESTGTSTIPSSTTTATTEPGILDQIKTAMEPVLKPIREATGLDNNTILMGMGGIVALLLFWPSGSGKKSKKKAPSDVEERLARLEREERMEFAPASQPVSSPVTVSVSAPISHSSREFSRNRAKGIPRTREHAAALHRIHTGGLGALHYKDKGSAQEDISYEVLPALQKRGYIDRTGGLTRRGERVAGRIGPRGRLNP